MKAAISLPDDIFEAAEAVIESRGWTRSRLYTEALRQYLRHLDPEDITSRLNDALPTTQDSTKLRRHANQAILKASDW